MTFHSWWKPQVVSYEFTAFTLSDLQSAGLRGGVSLGDHFRMPSHASACVTVHDDDGRLSGDRHGHATDASRQTGSVSVDGKHVNTGGQFYADDYFVLVDQHGRKYVLIEVKQEGSSQPFYTFHAGYGFPPAGTTLCVASKCDVSGEWIDYRHLTAGPKEPPLGEICGRLTFDADGNDNEWNDATGQWDAGIAGKTVELLDHSGKVVATTVTDAHGAYSFKVKPGEYQVRFTTKEGFEFSKQNSGVDEHYDSDADASGLTGKIVVKAGEKVSDVDAGLKKTDDGCCIVIEAEHMHLCGYTIEHDASASGGRAIKGKVGEYAWASTKFGGATGVYDLKLHVLDENDGQSFVWIYVNNHLVKHVRLDKDNGGNGGHDPRHYSTISVDDLNLKHGDTITIYGFGKGGEFVRIDKLEICKDKEPVLGALGDFVFFDENKNGLQDGDETGVEGVTVELIQNGAVIATTSTGADGRYLFDELPAGDYQVRFSNLPAGFELTAQDAGDDALDSDADATTGLTAVVSLAEGETNLTLDAGIVKSNVGPEAGNDAAKVCAGEDVVIDVLANDSDADSDNLFVAAIIDAGADGVLGTDDDVETMIAEGATVTLANGAAVTLTGGTLSYDSRDAFADLLIGQKDADSFQYVVADGQGGSATATVDVTVCGAKNTLETIVSSLPATVQFTLTPTGAGFVDALISSTDARLDGLLTNAAFCVDFDAPIIYGQPLTASVYLADAASAPDGLVPFEENLDLVNWIINQDFRSQGFTGVEIQNAIWSLTNGREPSIPTFLGDEADAEAIIALALANGEGFTPGEGDLIGLLLDPDPIFDEDNGISIDPQPFIIGVAFERLKQDCVCCDDCLV